MSWPQILLQLILYNKTDISSSINGGVYFQV